MFGRLSPFRQNQFFSNEKVNELVSKGLAIDCVKGGFLLGNSHADNGIPVLMRFADGYRIRAEFEGYEYVMNPAATQVYSQLLEEMNQYDKDKSAPLKIPDDLSGITILDCRTDSSEYKSKFLLTDARASQFIINKHSTLLDIMGLEILNNEAKAELRGPLAEWK